MSTRIRLLIADDSATVRRLLGETLAADGQFEICCAARDGYEAVTNFPQMRPDVVLLDIDMPVMDGIEATRVIRQIDPRVPIIMFSSLTVQGDRATLDALASGATDFVAKPVRIGHLHEAIAYIRNELIPRIKEWDLRLRSSQ